MKNILFLILSFFTISSFAQNYFPTTGNNQTAVIDGLHPYNGRLDLINGSIMNAFDNSHIIMDDNSYIQMEEGTRLITRNINIVPHVGSNMSNINIYNGNIRYEVSNNAQSGLLYTTSMPRKSGVAWPDPISGIGYIHNYFTPETSRLYMTHGNTPWSSNLGIQILPNGYTGIGTLSPTTRLHIETGITNDSGLRLANLTSSTPSSSGAKAIGVTSTGKVVTIDIDSASSSDRAWLTVGNDETIASTATYGNNVNNNFLGTTDNQPLVIATYNKERLRVSTSGRLTFHNNDISPNAVNNLYIGGGNEVPTGSSNYANTAIGLGSLPLVTSGGNRNLAIGSNALVRNSSGDNNIGIGYNAGANLTSGSNNIIIGNVNAPLSASTSNQLNIGGWIFGKNGQIAIGSFTNISQAFTNNEEYQLIVKKGIRTERIKVDLSSANAWADYVFDEDYDLLPLDELEKFIIKNKHLPDIPDADQLVENGIDLVEMDAGLLKKIEELTLYSVDLYKENKELKEENDRQQKLLNELVKRVEQLETNK